MDLHSILNASDSSDDDSPDDTDHNGVVDLEQILCESDDEGSDEDSYDLGRSRITADQILDTDAVELNRLKGESSATHSTSDWAILQSILMSDDEEGDNDDAEEEEEEEEWLKSSTTIKNNNLPFTKYESPVVKKSLLEDDSESDNLPANLPNTLLPPLAVATIQDDGKKTDRSPLRQNVTSSSSLFSGDNAINPTTKREKAQQRSEDSKSEEISIKAQAYSTSYEQKLLKSGQREMVSPLRVKRRLKQKIELTPRGKEPKKATRIAALSVTRFGSSGLVENKTLTGVSTSLEKHSKEGAKVLCGLPTCLAFNSKFIAVGTQRGIVLVYDLFEVLRQRLGATYDDNAGAMRAGPVTSIDLSFQGETVLSGHASGIVVVWDIIRGIVLRAVHDTHISPISSARFMSDWKVVTVDVGGIVNKISFTKNMIWSNYSVDTECLLDGTAGQILAMNVLPPYATIKTQQVRPDPLTDILKKLTLIALSSERSSFAVAVEPQINVLHRWARPPADKTDDVSINTGNNPVPSEFLPCLSWGWGLIAGGGNTVMPILARAWGCCLQLLCASFPSIDDGSLVESNSIHWPAFGVHREVDTGKPVVAVEWLNDRSLMYLTLTNEFTLVDTVMMTLLEKLDFSGLKLVYAEFALSRSSRTPGTDDENGQVSATTFQNSIRYSDDRLLVLCKNELKCISVVGARKRISSLEHDGEWLEALALALDYYDSAVVSLEDRRRDPSRKRDLSRHPDLFRARGEDDEEEWLSKLLVRYLNLAVENAPDVAHISTCGRVNNNGGNDLSRSHYQMLAGVCVEFCSVTRKPELLFGPVFQRFQSAGFSAIFFDVLEPYVLNDKIPYISAEAMSYFVEHCKMTKGISTVERCLLHMDCSIMDFDTILSLLRRNAMYTALFCIYNNGLDDFVSPLEIVLDKVFDEADAGSALLKRREDGVPQTDFEKLGYKALLYLKCCFMGKTFPREDELLTDEKCRKVRQDLLTFLTSKKYLSSSVRKGEQEYAGHRAFHYPYMRLLLLVDARSTLEAVTLALNAEDSQVLAFASIDEGWESGAQNAKSLPGSQEIVQILASIIQPGSQPPGMTPTTYRIATNAFLDFTSEYILKRAVRVDSEITYMILTRVCDSFEDATDSGMRRSTQKQVMDLVTSLPRDGYDPDTVLAIINKSGMHRAGLLLHQQVASTWIDSSRPDIMELRCRHFESAIECYVGDDDPEFRVEVYSYIKKECSGVTSDKDSESQRGLHKSVFSKLPELCKLSPQKTASLVADLFVDDIDQIVMSLEGNDEVQFSFLHVVASGELAQLDPAAASILILSLEHYHTYLALMAKLHPEMVYDYLVASDNYRATECLELCEKYDIPDASVYLLERSDKVNEAIRLGLQTLESKMMEMKRTVRGMEIDSFRTEYKSQRRSSRRDKQDAFPNRHDRTQESLKRMLTVILDVCERKSSEHGSKLWFTVLDRLITAKGFLRLAKEQPQHAKIMANVLSDLLRQTMQRMVSSVPLLDLVQKVTTGHSGSDLGELREMLESLLTAYNFELRVFEDVTTVFKQDVHEAKNQNRGLCVCGSRVDSILNIDLKAESAHEVSQILKSNRDSILQVGATSNACFVVGDRDFYNRKIENGFSKALTKLRSRRAGPLRDCGGRHSRLNFMTNEEQSVRLGEPDPIVMGPRPVKALGAAQHHGRLITF
ncbi:hypothetical protein FisN_25Hh077 [Fistulifera solaris]|uniref:Vacuolar protein sorting-associated protein 8 central domain-containing protein n=1 Tax=Fistulifera solaris TaxID=1519565 RepID=A0A1Z5JVM7_FISSO|nr:hypothetical protein FisN_25Hh077 [Fistulifera solaris]|eukprot:GAX18100.1 hypothetical protein FisN_25Hh077 [Fistulifera solaris]